MATKHIAAVCAGASVGVAYVALYSVKHHALSGIDLALPQALAAITLVFNIALMIDPIRFEPHRFGDLVHSKHVDRWHVPDLFSGALVHGQRVHHVAEVIPSIHPGNSPSASSRR